MLIIATFFIEQFYAICVNCTVYFRRSVDMVTREVYLNKIRGFYDSDSIKIIISNDETDYSTSVVRYIQLKDFLVMDSLDV